VASIAAVQQQLEPDQALLVYRISGFNLGPEETGEGLVSWVFVITRDRAEVLPVPSHARLEMRIAVYLGLLENRDGSELAAAEHLSSVLMGETLRGLPAKIRRLVIVPDNPLSQISFGTLPSVDGARLAERFEISYAPSATLWLRWRQAAPAVSLGAGVLAFADPELSLESRVAEERAGDTWLEGLRLGRLPHARREVLEVRRQLGGGEVRLGAGASEHFLKQTDLARFRVLHFAAHAVIDEDRPDRSSVVLAPGAGDEDGLLQVREIVDLDLKDRLVILTGCRSARGEALEGEGVMSLSHAVFQAGARAVVASLWPLRDDETAALMEEFARQLARGRSVSAALAAARRVRIEAGAPAVAWAGLVVLGDGDFVPVPGGRSPVPPYLWWLAPLVLLAALGIASLAWRRRRQPTVRQDMPHAS
jgi:hypothetical protein